MTKPLLTRARAPAAPGLFAGTLATALVCTSLGARAADEFTQHAAHEHGKATLDVALDGGRLEIRLTTPAINVLGFERAPRTDAERKAAADAAALLARHAQLFAFPVAARCSAAATKVDAPDWGDAKAGSRHEHKHDRDKDEHAHDHADYAVTWTFTCAAPAALGFFDAPLVGRLQPGTTVQANVITDALQTRQDLTATAARVRLK